MQFLEENAILPEYIQTISNTTEYIHLFKIFIFDLESNLEKKNLSSNLRPSLPEIERLKHNYQSFFSKDNFLYFFV